MNNKEVKIKCMLCDNLGIDYFYINIYDKNNNLIFSGKTNKFGTINFCFPCFDVYKICVFNYKKNLTKKSVVCYINDKFPNELLIVLNSLSKKTHPITFNVTDKYYKGLPITKGMMRLWNKQSL